MLKYKNTLVIVWALLLCSCQLFTQIPADSLVAYYPFNVNADDSSGNGYHGLVNGQIPVTGACASGYRFIGTKVICGDPTNNDFDLVNNASISLWIRLYSIPPGSSAGGYFTLLGKDVGPGAYQKWFLAITRSELIFHINTSIAIDWAVQYVFNFSQYRYYHLVLTKNNNTYKFYVNGILYGSKTLTINIVDVPSPLKIGDLNDGSATLDAALDEVLIYHRALDSIEINQLYNHCPLGPITPVQTILRDQTNGLKIYPIPTTGKLILSFSNAFSIVKNISVYNVIGENVFSQQYRIYNQNISIDLGTLPKGIYFLKTQIGNKMVIRKIVIQ